MDYRERVLTREGLQNESGTAKYRIIEREGRILFYLDYILRAKSSSEPKKYSKI